MTRSSNYVHVDSQGVSLTLRADWESEYAVILGMTV